MTKSQDDNTTTQAKKTAQNWCKHDIDSRLVPAMQLFIMKTGAAGYGFFWAVVEEMHRTSKSKQTLANIQTLGFVLGMKEDEIEHIKSWAIKSGLWVSTIDGVESARAADEIRERSERVNEIKDKRKQNGSRGGLAKASKSKQTLANSSKPYPEEIRLDEIRSDLYINSIGSIGGVGGNDTTASAVPSPVPELKIEKPKKVEKPLVDKFTHVRMTKEEVDRMIVDFPDKELRRYYYQAVDDYLEFNPKKRGRDCNRTVRAFIRSDKAAAKGWFTPKRGPWVNEKPQRQPFTPNGVEGELLSIYARRGKPTIS